MTETMSEHDLKDYKMDTINTKAIWQWHYNPANPLIL